MHAHFGADADAFLRSQLAASCSALESSRREIERLRAREASAQSSLATLAHEIRNPLASLELFIQLLEAEPARTAEVLIQMRAGLRGLHAAVGNVLRFYDGSPRPTPQFEPIVLGRILAESVEFTRPLVDRAGLDLRMRGASLGDMAMADAEALRQVILNLVGNAVRHTRAPGAVLIQLTRHEERLRISVSDTGEGIAPEHLPHIFRAGWSAAGSTGLGLAVCRRIAEEHGGSLRAESRLGKGSDFILELPAL